jgi:quercetin dioxygenase-like cupin family protein
MTLRFFSFRKALLLALTGALTPLAGLAAPMPPRVVLNIPRVLILRWKLAPGERTSDCAGTVDRIEIVVSGSGERESAADGRVTADVGPGWASYAPTSGSAYFFANTGSAPLDVVSVELVSGISGKTVPPGLKPGEVPPSQARLVTDRVVPSDILVNNDRIKMVRWIFQPGECSPIHIHALDHVYVVIRGSKIREITGQGKTNDDQQETGRVAFSPARGKIHSFANLGNSTYEMVSIELK